MLRQYARMGMTGLVVDALRAECRHHGIRYLRLDTVLDEQVVKKIYLDAGFRIVNIIGCPNSRAMALYELEV